MLGGCASLPANAPTMGQVDKAAKSTPAAPAPYTLVNIDAGVIRAQDHPQNLGVLQLRALSSGDAPARADLIRCGDTLSITIFEVGFSLFSGNAPQLAADPTRAPTAGTQTVSVQVREDGGIDLPYIGTVAAVGTYPEALAASIKRRFRYLSESPDVSVAVTVMLSVSARPLGTVPEKRSVVGLKLNQLGSGAPPARLA